MIRVRMLSALIPLLLVFSPALMANDPLPEPAELPALAEPGDAGLLHAEFIYPLEDRPTPQCHASTIVETADGLVAAWFGGTHEKHQDVGIWLSRQVDGQWTRPTELVDGSEGEAVEYPCWNPVLFQPGEGPLLLFYKVGPSPRLWWGMVMQSSDAGKSWSAPRKLGVSDALLAENQNLIGPVKNKPVQLDDGTILCPSSTENDGWRVHFEKTDPLAQEIAVIGPINDASKFDAIQPSILTHGDGRLQILCRSQQGVVVQSWSDDRGQTWSELSATELPNPNSGTDAVTLDDGRHLIVYNHTTRGGESPRDREMMNVAISSDGKRWTPVMTLEKSAGEFSYPAVIQTTDGKVHVTYTWQRRTVKHAVLDPAQLRTGSTNR